jgi:hypothetical protein
VRQQKHPLRTLALRTGVRCRADDHAQYEEAGSNHSNPAAPDDIGNRSHERADGSEGKQVRKHEPDPPIDTANVGIDVRRNTAKEVHRNLATRPYYTMLSACSEVVGHVQATYGTPWR